jgi:ssRNA-specific RNase YbeY (16S rRNA maturation enzyme)
MILLKNTQSIVKLPRQAVKRQIQLLLTAAGYRDWDVGVCLAGDKAVRALNAEYRGKDKSTDILSFPFAKVCTAQLWKLWIVQCGSIATTTMWPC